MRALLNSLGLTLWSSIAILLAVGLASVGYRLAMSNKDSPLTLSATTSAAPDSAPTPSPGASLDRWTSVSSAPRTSPVVAPQLRAASAALRAGRWQEALDQAQAAERTQGITVFDANRIAQLKAYAHLKLHRYSEALSEFQRVLDSGIATPEEKASIAGTLSELKAHEQSDREAASLEEAPARPPDGQSSLAGEPYVRLGMLYYGFGDYSKAVDALKRGIEKGSPSHLDEAYVYLGLAQQRLGNIPEAQRAFARLKSVPDISPKIVRLWALYSATLTDQLADSALIGASVTPPDPAN